MTSDIYNNEKIKKFKELLNTYNNNKIRYIDALEKLKMDVGDNIEKHVENRNNSANDNHKLYQVGLGDLNTDPGEYTYVKNAILTSKDNLEFQDSVKCSDKHMQKCRSRAMITNKKNYGITSQNNNNGCACYTLDDINNNTSISIEIVSKSVSHIPDNPSYIAILMDGELYSIKNRIFSKNFNKLYIKDNTNLKKLTIGTKRSDIGCNPFSGGGINSLSIHAIDEYADGSVKCVNKL